MLPIGPLKLKAQLLCGGEFAIGPGKADLLEAIDRRAMGMSYRRSWVLVDAMNRCWCEPLVETIPGGGPQKGARLTPLGREVLAAYRALEARLVEAATGPAFEALSRRMLPTPRPSQERPPVMSDPDTPS
jgi:molybdate transport system regulatory protein